jgi:hypothetical protein
VAAVIGSMVTAGVVTAAVQAGTEPQCVGTACVEQFELADRAVTAEKLASGDLTNFAEDGSFERTPANQLPVSRSWPGRSGTPAWKVISVGTRGDCYRGTRCATRDGDGTNSTARLTNAVVLDAQAGEQLRFTGALKSSDGANGTARVVVEWLNNDGVVLGSGQASRSPSTIWVVVSGTAQAPTGTTRARAAFEAVSHGAGTWYADALTIRRVLPGGELAADAVDGSKIKNASVQQMDIGPNAVLGSHVQDGSLSISDFLLSSVDSRYATKASLQGGTVNSTGNPVSWGRLLGVPAGLADGVDNAEPMGYEGRKADTGGLCDAYCSEGEMTLPAGSFHIQARIELHQEEVHYLVAKCRLQFGGRTDTAYLHVHADNEDVPVTMSLMGSQTASGVARVSCEDYTQGAVFGRNLVITATRLKTFSAVTLP